MAPKIDNLHSKHWMYTAVALLRVLILKRDDMTKWETVQELMDHWEDTHYLSTAWQRKEEIRAEWMFDCNCLRCADDSDLFMSFLKCLKCDGFYNQKSDCSLNFSCSQ